MAKRANAAIQPKMENAPVQVAREGNSVTISAYINFTGSVADEYFPCTPQSRMTYAEVGAAGIIDSWKGNFNIYGQDVNVRTNLYSNNFSPNNIMLKPVINNEQRYIKFRIKDKGRILFFDARAHTDLNIIGIVTNMITKDEKDVLTWDIGNSTNATIYTNKGNLALSEAQFGQIFAHEFGHCLGLGDAYNAGNRGGSGVFAQNGYYAPASYRVEDPYSGNWMEVEVPSGDIMLNNQYVTDNDIRMVLEAYRTGEIQTFPYGTKDYDKRASKK